MLQIRIKSCYGRYLISAQLFVSKISILSFVAVESIPDCVQLVDPESFSHSKCNNISMDNFNGVDLHVTRIMTIGGEVLVQEEICLNCNFVLANSPLSG